MIPITLATIITCSQAISLIDRLASISSLSRAQKEEIVLEIRKVIKSCPIKIKDDKKS
jgi:hypothetical protein